MRRGDVVYHRYIPNPDGSYRREVVNSAPVVQEDAPIAAERAECMPASAGAPQHTARRQEHVLARLLPRGMETGDMLVLLILLLLLIDGDEDDSLSVLLTLAAFILL